MINKLNYSIQKAEKQYIPIIFGILNSHDLPLEGIEEHLDHFLILAYKEENSSENTTAHEGNNSFQNFAKNTIGVVGLELYDEIALLRSLAVDRKFNGMGFGRILMTEIEIMAKELGIVKMYLFTNTAQEFMKYFGYEILDISNIDNRLKVSKEYTICKSAVFMAKNL